MLTWCQVCGAPDVVTDHQAPSNAPARGAPAVRYAPLIAPVAIVIIATVTLLGSNVTSVPNQKATEI